MIPGEIIHLCRDNDGDITIADDRGVRSLYFHGHILQSSIRLEAPGKLIEEYNQAMMSALLFKPTPRRALLVGLGGCSLIHFLMHAFPACSLDVIEIRQRIIDLAHQYFFLPAQHVGLRIFHEAGQDFILRCRDRDPKYDLILVDAFEEDGPAAPLLAMGFLHACRMHLARDGIFAINLWNRPKDNFPVIYGRIQEAFGNNTLKLLLAEMFRNVIVFGFNDPSLFSDLHATRTEAGRLQREHDINFRKYQRYLYWQNFK
ncbi:MAG TPA: hypothetical protein VEP69_04720 [Thermodesulfovibrionales bacterium]|nr:hypothetical protein [Thermodesulfovibrionales bacterium]